MSKKSNHASVKKKARRDPKVANGSFSSTGNSYLLIDGQKNFILGLDDCVCKIGAFHPDELTAKQVLAAVEVHGAKEWVNEMFDCGYLICFFTSRSEKLRSATEKWLRSHGFRYHSLVCGKPIARIYHYIDDRHVQATTFRGSYTPLVRKEHRIEVFS